MDTFINLVQYFIDLVLYGKEITQNWYELGLNWIAHRYCWVHKFLQPNNNFKGLHSFFIALFQAL